MTIQNDLPEDPSKGFNDKNFLFRVFLSFYRFFKKLRNNYGYIKTVTASETLSIDDCNINADASSGAIVLTLPSIDGSSRGRDAEGIPNGKEYSIKKIDSSANTVTISVDGGESETIDGSTTLVIVFQYDCPKLVLDDSNWWIR